MHADETDDRDTIRRPYRAPELRALGGVVEVTQTSDYAGNPTADGGGAGPYAGYAT